MGVLSIVLNSINALYSAYENDKAKRIMREYTHTVLTTNIFLYKSLIGCSTDQAKALRDSLYAYGVTPLKTLQRIEDEYEYTTVDGGTGTFTINDTYELMHLVYNGESLK